MRLEQVLGGIWLATPARAEPDNSRKKDAEEDASENTDADYKGW